MTGKRKIPESDAGRIAGLIKRTDPDLWEQLRADADAMGVPVSEVIKQYIKAGRNYEMYKDINGADIMKVMDILDRIFQYMFMWMGGITSMAEKYSIEKMVETYKIMDELGDLMAQYKGYVRPEQIKEVVKSPEKRSTLLDYVISRAIDHLVDKAVQRMEETGMLDKVAEVVAHSVASSTAQVAKEAVKEIGEPPEVNE